MTERRLRDAELGSSLREAALVRDDKEPQQVVEVRFRQGRLSTGEADFMPLVDRCKRIAPANQADPSPLSSAHDVQFTRYSERS